MKIGIIGGAGYTAGELIRLLINHPEAEITFIHSESNAGNPVTNVHGGLLGETDLCFSSEAPLDKIDVLFLCSGHGQSSAYWSSHDLPDSLKVIDLSQDYRDEHDGYVYGLPELNAARIATSRLIANPGCFATAIQLAVLPLAQSHLLKHDIHVTAITGSTGAGVKPSATTHFSWRNDNISVYKLFEHQHLLEINRTVKSLQPDYTGEINFVPMRGDFARGIFASVYTECDLSEEEAVGLYKHFYSEAPFTVVSDRPVDLKQAVNTNKAIVHVEKHGDKLHISSVIDNLLKGASGQAVENMNLIFGLGRRTGLQLKPSAF